MRIRHTIWGGLLLALAACSGGGGGGGGTTLAPAAGPPSFDNATGTKTFQATSVVGTYSADLTTGSTGHSNLSPSTQIIVNFDTGTIRILVSQLTDAGATILFDQTFGAGDLIGSANGFLFFQNAGGELLIYDAQTNPTGLKYTNFGVWGAGTTAIPVGAAAIGFVTNAGNLPTTGTARYEGQTIGLGVEAGAAFGIAGLVTLDANFGTGAITGLFHDMVRSDQDQNLSAFEDMAVAASINAGTSTYSGALSSARPGFSSGDVEGAFFGPNAEETGGTWRLKADTGDDAYGGSYGATQ